MTWLTQQCLALIDNRAPHTLCISVHCCVRRAQTTAHLAMCRSSPPADVSLQQAPRATHALQHSRPCLSGSRPAMMAHMQRLSSAALPASSGGARRTLATYRFNRPMQTFGPGNIAAASALPSRPFLLSSAGLVPLPEPQSSLQEAEASNTGFQRDCCPVLALYV